MTTMVLRQVKVLSLAAWMSLPLAVMGICAGVIYDISLWQSGERSLSLVIFYFVSLLIEYAFVGFIGTAIAGLIHNSVGGSKGGIVLQFDVIASGSDSRSVQE